MILQADTYLQTGEAFHLARFALPPTRPATPHSHDFFEVFLIEEGIAHHLINEESDELGAGSLCYIRPHDEHALWSKRGAPARLINLMFRADTVVGLLERYPAELSGRFLDSRFAQPEKSYLDPAQIVDLLNDFNALIPSPRTQLMLDGFLTRLLSLQSRAGGMSQAVPLWLSDGLQNADHPQFLRLGARGLAKACGRSQEHVARIVKQKLCKTPSEIMNAKRISYASHLLLSTDQTIETIGFACGFENQSYFFRLFKAHHGVTPRQFRQDKFRNPVVPA